MEGNGAEEWKAAVRVGVGYSPCRPRPVRGADESLALKRPLALVVTSKLDECLAGHISVRNGESRSHAAAYDELFRRGHIGWLMSVGASAYSTLKRRLITGLGMLAVAVWFGFIALFEHFSATRPP